MTSQTNAVGRRWLCPRLPTPPSTEPANWDGLQLRLSFSLAYCVCSRLKLRPPIQPHFGSCLCNVSVAAALLLFTFRPSAPLHSPVSNRHSAHNYCALLSLPAVCQRNFDVSQWTLTSCNILASTRGISRIRLTFRRYLSVRFIMRVTVSSRRDLYVGTAQSAVLEVWMCRWQHLPKQRTDKLTVDIFMPST